MSNETASKKELVGWAYVRVSTADQSNVLHGSIEQQQNRIKRWESEQSARIGIVHKITRYIDEDISGRAESLHKRREYHELVTAIKKRTIDFVVVEKLDRLHRDIIESRKFIDLCDEMGIKFYRLDGGLVDLKDRSSRTSVFIESWMAEEYSLDLVEKLTKKGREARVNNGKDNQSMPVLGLDEHPTEACFYVINKAEQQVVVDIFRYFSSCGDLQKTASYCNKKGYRTKERYTRPKLEKGKKIPPKLVGGEPYNRKNLRALLVSRKIAGFGFFKDDWNQFPKLQDEHGMVKWHFRHGPVIDPELFEAVQAILRKNAKYNHRIYNDQRTYFLSGILFDKDGNSFHGESAKNKSNFYYENRKKNYRIRAELIEGEVIKYLSNLLKENGLLGQKLKELFNAEQSPLKKLDNEIAHKQKEIRQCERVIEVMASKERMQIMENPELVHDILLQSMRVRRECEARIEELGKELDLLHKGREELARFVEVDDVCKKLKHALEVFKKSWSIRKKQLIQVMLPKLVVDESKDELRFYINPLLDKSIKFKDLEDSQGEPILTLRPEMLAGEKKSPMALVLENVDKKGCHIEEKNSCSGQMAG